MKSYIKPRSVSFLAGASMVLAGLVMALAEAIAPLEPVRAVLSAIYHGMAPGALISMGFGVIGIRRAVDPDRQKK